jgi:FMN phosphatase YigB (HAD superfamily)
VFFYGEISMSIKNIIFDLGNVLFLYNPEKIIKSLLPETKNKQEYLEKLFLNSMWINKLDKGLFNHKEAKEYLTKTVNLNLEKTMDLCKLYDNWVYHLDIVNGSKDIFNSLLENNYKVYLLTNFQDEPFDRLIETHPFLKKAHGEVVSAKVKMLKPEPEIYEHLLQKYQLVAEECVFVDDKKENIDAAQAMGIHGIVFESSEQFSQDLKKLAVEF